MNDKPIRTRYETKIEYTVNGLLHREDGPAVIWYDGEMKWLINGEMSCHKP